MDALSKRLDSPVEITVTAPELTSMNESNEAEIGTPAKPVANDGVPDGEISADTWSLRHQSSSSPTMTVKCVENTRSPQALSDSKQKKRNDALNTTLDRISFVLDVLSDVADLIPVAGFASAVPIVRRIVDHLSVSVLQL
jgi:hypothetical protein